MPGDCRGRRPSWADGGGDPRHGPREARAGGPGVPGLSDTHRLLVERAQRGDVAAWHALWPTLVPTIRNVAQRLLPPDELDDAVQEVVVDVWQSIRSFRWRSPFRSWVRSVAAHTCLAILDKTAHRQALFQQWASGLRDVRTVPNPGALAEAKELGAVVRECLSGLDEGDRDVLVLKYFCNMSHQGVADALGSTGGAVRKRWSRAYERLREVLERRVNGSEPDSKA